MFDSFDIFCAILKYKIDNGNLELLMQMIKNGCVKNIIRNEGLFWLKNIYLKIKTNQIYA